ncbi:MAG: hypothetical protein HND48_05525 [Chloroflexi bacterium]|nr:hypothetical protein [Chloroflexota bacterium]
MVTTHHPELKVYSVETPGVRNASVEFDLETLAPTYRLIVGLPGRSNALAIARRLGLDESIIETARGMVATEDLIADDLLDEIHRTREMIRRQNAGGRGAASGIARAAGHLQARLDKIEDERRDIINAARRNAETELAELQREIKRLRSDMRTAGLPLDALRRCRWGPTASTARTARRLRMSPKRSNATSGIRASVIRSGWRRSTWKVSSPNYPGAMSSCRSEAARPRRHRRTAEARRQQKAPDEARAAACVCRDRAERPTG